MIVSFPLLSSNPLDWLTYLSPVPCLQRDAYLLSRNSRISRLFVILATLFWFIGLLGFDLSALTLSLDGIFTHGRIWAFLSAGLYEQHLLSGLLSLSGLALAAPLLEKHWGSRRTFRFFLYVSPLSFLGVFLTLLVCWIIGLGPADSVWYTRLSGLPGVLGGFSVALKQRFGDWRLAYALRARHLPTVLLLIFLGILCIHLLAASSLDQISSTETGIGEDVVVPSSTPSWLPYAVHWGPLLTTIWGIYFGWLYLRFYDRDDDQQTVGDLSPSFAFSTFLPDFLAPSLGPVVERYVSRPLYRIATQRFHLFSQARASAFGPLPHADFLPSPSSRLLRSDGSESLLEAGRGHGVPGPRNQSSASLLSRAWSGAPSTPTEHSTPDADFFDYENLLLDTDGLDAESSFLSEDPESQRRIAVAIKAVDDKLARLAGGALDDVTRPESEAQPRSVHSAPPPGSRLQRKQRQQQPPNREHTSAPTLANSCD